MILKNPDDMYAVRRSNALAGVWVKHDISYATIKNGFPFRKPVRVSPNIERCYDNIIRARRSMTYYIRTEEQDIAHYARRLA